MYLILSYLILSYHIFSFCYDVFQEELNAQNSANYDVELLHSSDAHEELIKTGKRKNTA